MNPISAKPAARTAIARRSLTAKELSLCGMSAALLAAISQVSLPMPTGVPITIQVFGITLAGVMLGWRLGLFATVTYILIGAAGLPVFSNFRGGFSVLAGPAGGYVWAWPFMVMLCGIRPKTGNPRLNSVLTAILSLIGLSVMEIIGGLQWAALSGEMSVGAVFTYAAVAFIPKDTALALLAVILGIPMRRIISKG